MEMQCAQRAVASGGATIRLHFRGRVPSAYDRQGPQSRHRLVFDAGSRMAGATRRFRAVARPGEFRCRRRPDRFSVLNERSAAIMTATIEEKRLAFVALHRGPGCFIMPNPWDIGSTIYLSTLGFKALATTSRGAAFAMGRPDGGLKRAQVLDHMRAMVAASDLPFNADFENGFGEDHQTLAESMRLGVETGVAGLSIEDYS